MMCLFSALYFGLTLMLLAWSGEDGALGNRWIWLAVVLACLVLWVSLALPSLKSIARRLAGDDLPAYGRDPIRQEKLASVHVPRGETIRIVLLSSIIICTAAWFTTNSGGPFVSPFGQFLLAIPLLAVSLSSRRGMVVAVSVMTLAAAAIAQLAVCPFNLWFGQGVRGCAIASAAGSPWWYAYASTATIIVSALLTEATGTASDRSLARRLFPWWYITGENGRILLKSCAAPQSSLTHVVITPITGSFWQVEKSVDGSFDISALADRAPAGATVDVGVKSDTRRLKSPTTPILIIPGQVREGYVLLAGVVFKRSFEELRAASTTVGDSTVGDYGPQLREEDPFRDDYISVTEYEGVLRSIWSE